MRTEIQLTNGETFAHKTQSVKRATVKTSGWVKVKYDESGHEYHAHIPPHRVEQILGDVNHDMMGSEL